MTCAAVAWMLALFHMSSSTYCPNYTIPRETLIADIENIFRIADIPYHLRTLDISTILGPNEALPPDIRLSIRKATARFISDSKAKI